MCCRQEGGTFVGHNRLLLVLLLVAIVSFALPLRAEVRPRPVTPEEALAPLIYAHVVVDCTIESVRKEVVTLSQVLDLPSPESDRKIGILIAKLSNTIVLRGHGVPQEVEIATELRPRELVGQRLLLCCYWKPKLGMFTVPFERFAFRRDGSRWISMRTDVTSTGEPAGITQEELEVRIRNVELPNLTREADVIVVGKVVAVLDTIITDASTGRFRAQRIDMEVSDVLKGVGTSKLLSFFVARGINPPVWRTATPASFRVGETWLALLDRFEGVLCPASGLNGLLLFTGDKVMYDRSVEYSSSRSMLLKEIREVVSDQ